MVPTEESRGATSATGWLPAAVELSAYEGMRRGDEDAFRRIAEPLQPTLRRVAALYVGSDTDADAVVLRSWEAALRGLGTFRWHTPLATWIARITVAHGRGGHRRTGPTPLPSPPVPARGGPGPEDWSDLPWGPRWELAAPTLESALAALPLRQLEVVHGRDREGWPGPRVRDVFGLPEATYHRLLEEARSHLHRSLGVLVGRADAGPHLAAQMAVIRTWLHSQVGDRPQQLDPRALTVFRRWAATREAGWRRLGLRLRPVTDRA